jgi:hypothetical protein
LFQNNRDNSSKLPNYNTVKYMFLRKWGTKVWVLKENLFIMLWKTGI